MVSSQLLPPCAVIISLAHLCRPKPTCEWSQASVCTWVITGQRGEGKTVCGLLPSCLSVAFASTGFSDRKLRLTSLKKLSHLAAGWRTENWCCCCWWGVEFQQQWKKLNREMERRWQAWPQASFPPGCRWLQALRRSERSCRRAGPWRDSMSRWRASGRCLRSQLSPALWVQPLAAGFVFAIQDYHFLCW